MSSGRVGVLVVAALVGGARVGAGQSAADSARIVATARDYIEGWYAGDPARMARALHPELVKRIQVSDSATGRRLIDNQGFSRLVFNTARGGGTRTPKERQRTDVRLLDLFRNVAAVRIDAGEWIDYLQLVRDGDRWLILNVLWELRG